jgi:hypothetical protein
LISFDRIGERPDADAKNIAPVIDEMAGGLDRRLGARKPLDAIGPTLPKLDVPCHSAENGANRRNRQLRSSTQSEDCAAARRRGPRRFRPPRRMARAGGPASLAAAFRAVTKGGLGKAVGGARKRRSP